MWKKPQAIFSESGDKGNREDRQPLVTKEIYGLWRHRVAVKIVDW